MSILTPDCTNCQHTETSYPLLLQKVCTGVIKSVNKFRLLNFTSRSSRLLVLIGHRETFRVQLHVTLNIYSLERPHMPPIIILQYLPYFYSKFNIPMKQRFSRDSFTWYATEMSSLSQRRSANAACRKPPFVLRWYFFHRTTVSPSPTTSLVASSTKSARFTCAALFLCV